MQLNIYTEGQIKEHKWNESGVPLFVSILL